MRRRTHLREDRLIEAYFNGRTGTSAGGPEAEHLAVCPSCRARLQEVAGFLDGLQTLAEAETDVVFGPGHLHDQQGLIARRLERLGHPARILSFPARVGRRMTATASRVAPRWVAAALAVGLFVGAGAGMFFDAVRPARQASGGSGHTSPARDVGAFTGPAAAPDDDEAFVADLELALEQPHTRALQPLDAMTPQVREVSAPLR